MKKCALSSQIKNFILKINFLPPFFARIVLSLVFIGSGWGKINNIDRTIAYFTNLGIPNAELLAPFVASVEFVFGGLLLAGIMSRLAAIPLAFTMLVAIFTARSEDISGVLSLFEMSEFLYIVMLFWLIIQGAGKISLDYILVRKFNTCIFW